MKTNNWRSGSKAVKRSNVDNGNFSRSIAAMKYYSHGTQAAKIEEQRDDVSIKYYEQFVKIENKTVARGSIAKMLCILISFFCCILVIFAKCKVYDYQLDNEDLLKALETSREKSASLSASNNQRIDLAYIEEQAVRLNMAKPQSYQIVYIEVPKTDYTVNHEAQTVIEKEKAMVVSYRNFVSGIKEAKELFMPEKNQ